MVGRQNADIADTLHLRDVATATTFWLSMGYDFGCVIDSVMSCMRVCRKQALSRVKYYYYATISKIQQATIMTV